MIKLLNVSKQYTNNKTMFSALSNINLSINEGEIFGIVGVSGAGKSTLLRMINGLNKPDSGDVLIFDTNINKINNKDLRGIRKQIGFVSQEFGLIGNKTVIDNVAIPLILQGIKKDIAIANALKMLLYVGLSDKEKAYPNQLSGGQKQRVAIARALITKPKILLCDEFTSALDDKTMVEILKLLKTIHNDLNITIVIISHEIKVVKYLCNRVLVLDNGIATDTIKLSSKNKGSLSDAFLSYKEQLLKGVIAND